MSGGHMRVQGGREGGGDEGRRDSRSLFISLLLPGFGAQCFLSGDGVGVALLPVSGNLMGSKPPRNSHAALCVGLSPGPHLAASW